MLLRIPCSDIISHLAHLLSTFRLPSLVFFQSFGNHGSPVGFGDQCMTGVGQLLVERVQ
jgi:hypothetical protein